MEMFANNNYIYRHNVTDRPLVKSTYVQWFEGQLKSDGLQQQYTYLRNNTLQVNGERLTLRQIQNRTSFIDFDDT